MVTRARQDAQSLRRRDVGNSTFYLPGAAAQEYVSSTEESIQADLVSEKALESFVNERNFEYSVSALRSLKEDWVTSQMKARESEFTEFQQLRICVGTYNVNGKEPLEKNQFKEVVGILDLKPWVDLSGPDTPDIYVLGFQELDLSAEAFVFDNSSREEGWARALEASFPSGIPYHKLKTKILVGMLIMVFVKKSLLPHISDLESAAQGTGIMGMMGNKGGVAVRFSIFNTSICFVNSHLAAHDDAVQRRNQDHHEICRRINFSFSKDATVFDHELDLPIGEVKAAVAKMNLDLLLEHDQLVAQRRHGAAFRNFIEPPIDFPPTYKFDPGTDTFDTSEKMRSPAYCDRVMYLAKEPADVEQVLYESCPGVRVSDHKPVRAVITIKVKIVDQDKKMDVYHATTGHLDALENKAIPNMELSNNQFDFGTVYYGCPQSRELVVRNTGQVLSRFRFIPKLDETTIRPDWLWIEPIAGLLAPGETAKVKLTVMVESNAATRLNRGGSLLDDILILHLEDGKDSFIHVHGKYQRSSFCTSISDLVRMPHAARQYALGPIHKEVGQELHIPKELWTLIDFLYRSGLQEEGLFFVSGNRKQLHMLMECLDTSTAIPEDTSVHTVAETILRFLKAMPDAVIPRSMHRRCLACAQSELLSRQAIADLPAANQCTFLYLMAFLQQVLKHSDKNSCTLHALTSLFSRVVFQESPKSGLDPAMEEQASENCKFFCLHFIAAAEPAA